MSRSRGRSDFELTRGLAKAEPMTMDTRGRKIGSIMAVLSEGLATIVLIHDNGISSRL